MKQSRRILLELLGDGDESVRTQVIEALGKLGVNDRNVGDALAKAMEDESAEVRVQAAAAIWSRPVKSHRAIKVLIEVLETEGLDSSLARVEAAKLLGRIGQAAKVALPQLNQATEDDEDDLRAQAALAVWRITAEAGRPVAVLTEILRNPLSGENSEAAEAIGEIGAPAVAAVPALIEFIQDAPADNPPKSAVEALKRISPAAAERAGIK